MTQQPTRLERLIAAHTRVEELQAAGVEMNSKEAHAAVNSLITIIRGASPEELQAFDAWKAERKK